MSRDFHKVLLEIIAEVPEAEQSIILDLAMIGQSYAYTAPEVIYCGWQDVADYLNAHCNPKNSDWEMRIYKIFRGEDDTEK